MPDDPPAPQPQPTPQPAPVPTPAPPLHPIDQDLPDDDVPTTRSFTRLRNAHTTAQNRIKDLERENADLKTSASAADTLRGRLIEQAIIARASGKLAVPSDAVLLLRDQIKLGKDNTVDEKAIDAAIDKLLEERPTWKAGQHTSPRPLPNGGGSPPVPVGASGSPNQQMNDLIRRAASGR